MWVLLLIINWNEMRTLIAINGTVCARDGKSGQQNPLFEEWIQLSVVIAQAMAVIGSIQSHNYWFRFVEWSATQVHAVIYISCRIFIGFGLFYDFKNQTTPNQFSHFCSLSKFTHRVNSSLTNLNRKNCRCEFAIGDGSSGSNWIHCTTILRRWRFKSVDAFRNLSNLLNIFV